MKRMWKKAVAVLLCLTMLMTVAPAGFAKTQQSAAAAYDLTVNYESEPMAVDQSAVRFGWKMQSDAIGAAQSAYQIVVTDGDSVVWDSGKVESAQSVAVAYAGDMLEKETVYTWSVTVYDQDGRPSQPVQSRFATGCDFSGAQWIVPVDADSDSVKLLRTERPLAGKVQSAQLYITAMGIYTAYLNGREVMKQVDGERMDDTFAPGWTDYTDYVNYQGYDVTEYLNGTSVCLGIELGKGWYGGLIGQNAHYESVIGSGDTRELAAIAQLMITYEDGTREILATDDSWKSSGNSPIIYNDFYMGEHYDANLEAAVEGWNNAGFDASAWSGVTAADYQPGDLRPSTKTSAYFLESDAISAVDAYTYDPDAPVVGEVTDTYAGAVTQKPADVSGDIALKAGDRLILDMGVNTAAVMEVIMSGEKGTEVTLRHAEILNDGLTSADGYRKSDGPAGTLFQANLSEGANLGEGTAVDVYTMKGAQKETYRPAYTYHGYRYVEISATKDIVVKSARSIPVTSSIRQTGFLETSDASVNQLIANALNSHRSNFTTIPTDCPQRQERWGWTGDIQLYAETSVYNYDSVAFLENYLEILNETAPKFGDAYGAAAPNYADWLTQMMCCGWSDVGIILPWVLYQQTGDTTMIETYFDQMNRYMNVVYTKGYNPRLFGDWIASSGTSTVCMNALYEYYITFLMAKMAGLTKHSNEQGLYEQKQEELKEKYLNKFFDKEGNLLSSSTPDGQTVGNRGEPVTDNAQSGLLWSLKLSLYRDESHKQYLIDRLIENIRNEGNSIRPADGETTLSVGFLGVNVLLPVLTEMGAGEVSYDLMMQDEIPSWLGTVKNGATSIWESWNTYIEGEGIRSKSNSFNHFSYGACLEWMYENMSGIQKDESNPGFKNTILQPSVDASGRISFVNGSYESYYGAIESNWTADDGQMNSYHAAVPANTTATLYLPVEASDVIVNTSGAKYVGDDIHNGQICAKFELAAGGYDFTIENGVITVNVAEGYVDDGAAVQSIDAPEAAQVGSDFDVTVVTAGSVTDVKLYNEYDMAIGAKAVNVTENEDGTKTFVIKVSLGTVGNDRVIKAVTKDASGILTDSGESVMIDITSIPPVLSSFDLPDTAVANRTFIVKATTDMAATKIAVYNEFGTKMGIKSLSYKVVDGQKVWTGVMAIGTKGDRTFTATAVNKYGAQSDVLTDSISVKAFA